MKKIIRLLLLATMLLFGSTYAQGFDIQIGNVGTAYLQGSGALASISVRLADSSIEFENAVIFLNVVEIDQARKYPQAAHKIFASANIDNAIFKTIFSKEDLLAGVSANINYVFKKQAKIAQYALVIQVFEGTNTNPHRLRGKHRLAMKAHNFYILER